VCRKFLNAVIPSVAFIVTKVIIDLPLLEMISGAQHSIIKLTDSSPMVGITAENSFPE
jgi:hypothetical protein